MAKKPVVRQAYAATLIVKGKPVPPGTPVTLDADEAKRIGDMFGVVPAKEELPSSIEPDSDILNKAVIAALEATVTRAQSEYEEAEKALNGPTANDETAKRFEEAEKALDAAKAELEKAQNK